MKIIKLDKEDTEQYNTNGYVFVDIYVIFKDQVNHGWEWAINPDDARWYDPETDELYYQIKFNADCTAVIDEDDWDEDFDE